MQPSFRASSKEAMVGHDRQRIARMLDTWIKDRRLQGCEKMVNRAPKEFVTAYPAIPKVVQGLCRCSNYTATSPRPS